jgi:tRNA(His) guanylyltransferase
MKDELGDRMKSYYEDRTRIHLPRKTFTIIRIDGKAFHTYTRGLERPFDTDLIDDMDATTKFICESIQGAKLGYVQSDEISILLTDFDKIDTDAWFDGNVQKIVSIASSLATAKFNQLRAARSKGDKLAHFDARVFTIPQLEEAMNYFIWRQTDATRNSISSVAQSLYSHTQLNGKTTDMMQDLIHEKGQNWNDYPAGQKRGRVIVKRKVRLPISKEIFEKAKDKSNFVWSSDEGYQITRNQWMIEEPPIFTKDKDYLRYPIQNIVFLAENKKGA